MAVVAFHADIRFCSGGYVGVDLFFVISGFLIGSILLKDIDSGTFSAAEFYKRRVLRIVPALFVVLLVLTITLPFVLFPQGVKDFTGSLRSVLFSISNFYYASHSSYFSEPYGKPLLHTWSLAVEEQFYLALPPLLLLLKRLSERFCRLALLILFLASVVTSVVQVSNNPNAAFYLPLSRSWELLLGTLLTYLLSGSRRRPQWFREAMLILGLLLICGSIHYYSAKTPFPGLLAFLPCAGAALLILFGGDGRLTVNKLLCWKPLVFVGLVSYSLYLWHWPVTVLTKMGALPFLPADHRSQTILIIIVSGILAILSWRYVEGPFRTRALRSLPPAKVLSSFGLACVGFFIVSIVLARIPSPFPKEALAMSRYSDQVDNQGYRKGLCYVGDPYSFSDYHAKKCLAIDRKRTNVLILGDSHAAAIYPGLQQVFPEVNFLQASAQGCKPIKDTTYSTDCKALMKFIFYDFLPQNKVDMVFLIGRWLDESDIADLDGTIAYLQSLGEKVVLVGPSPEYRIPLPRLIAYSISRHDPSLPGRYQADDLFRVDDIYRRHAASLGIAYLSPLSLLCQKGRCVQLVSSSSQIPLLFDSNHFTVEGSELFAERLRQEKDFPFGEEQDDPADEQQTHAY
jgi:peptidoglycan/LPS O-acetylase OafA/YrhL